MRIFLNGIGAFGADTLERLEKDGQEVVAVAAPTASLSGRPDRLFAAAESRGIPTIDVVRISQSETEGLLKQVAPDLGVMAFVQRKIPNRILDLPHSGTIQYHPSLLPAHRGRSAVNWSIIMGETVTGATIFWPDAGLDTGPLLIQRPVPIDPGDTAGSLYRDKLYPLGLELLSEAVRMVEFGEAAKTPQDEALATYEPPCEGNLARVDWRKTAHEISNLIRGCDPSPGAWTAHNGRKLRLAEPVELPDQRGTAGLVVQVEEDGIVVGASRGAVRVRNVQLEDGHYLDLRQMAMTVGLKSGTQIAPLEDE